MKTRDNELKGSSAHSEPIHKEPHDTTDTDQSAFMKRGITMRSFVIGLILAAFNTAFAVKEEVGSNFPMVGSAGMILGTALALILVLLTVNSVLKRTKPLWMFSPTEIMVMFMTMSMATFAAGFDMLEMLFPFLLWPFYFDTPAAGFSRFFKYIPDWFVPKDKEIIRQFYIGSRDYWYFFRPEILKAWLVPMLFWGGFVFLLMFTMLCLTSILRRQWMDREKLSFPIVNLPLDMARGVTIGSLLRNRVFMAGFLLVTAVYSWNGISIIFPAVPGLCLNVTDVGHMFLRDAPLKGMNPIYVQWSASNIGFCYLVPLDVLFSSWFFWVLIRLSCIPATSLGLRNPDAGLAATADWPYYNNLAEGALIGLSVVVLWNARKHLREIVRTAFSKEKIPGDDKEPLPYKTAFFGAVGGFMLLVGIIIASGMRAHIALLFFAIYFLAMIVMARVFAQLALPGLGFYFFNTGSFLSNLVGTSGMNHQDHTILASLYFFNRGYGQHPMGHELEAMVLADRQKQSMRRMSGVILVAIAVGIAVGMVSILRTYYDRGGATANVMTWMTTVGPVETWHKFEAAIADPKPVQFVTIARAAASAGIVLLLGFARNMWLRFPLNPVGYVLASSYTMEYLWNVALVSWLIKLLVIRYGGLRSYRKTLPFFYGLIIADVVCGLSWGVVFRLLGITNASLLGPIRW